MAKFDRDQKAALMIPAKEAYGDIAKWDEKVLGGLCNLLEALPVRDILNLAADVVSISIPSCLCLKKAAPQGSNANSFYLNGHTVWASSRLRS